MKCVIVKVRVKKHNKLLRYKIVTQDFLLLNLSMERVKSDIDITWTMSADPISRTFEKTDTRLPSFGMYSRNTAGAK